MLHTESPHRLSGAIEAFKADLNSNLNSSGALASLKDCLKNHLSAGHKSSRIRNSDGNSLPRLAHSIIAEYLEGAELKYTLPVFLSETCQSEQPSQALTQQLLSEQLGISQSSSFGRAFAFSAPRRSASSQGKNGSFLLGLLQAVRLLCSNEDGEVHPQILQVQDPGYQPMAEQQVQRSIIGLDQGLSMPDPRGEPRLHQASPSKAAFALIRKLRMELHSSQHLCGMLLRELTSFELEHRDCRSGLPSHTKQRIAFLQESLLSQQKRTARLEKGEAALLQQSEQWQHKGVPSAGCQLPCFCADTWSTDSAERTYSSSDAVSPAQSGRTGPSCLSEPLLHARHRAGQQIRPLKVPVEGSAPAAYVLQQDLRTQPCEGVQQQHFDSACSSTARSQTASSQAGPSARFSNIGEHHSASPEPTLAQPQKSIEPCVGNQRQPRLSACSSTAGSQVPTSQASPVFRPPAAASACQDADSSFTWPTESGAHALADSSTAHMMEGAGRPAYLQVARLDEPAFEHASDARAAESHERDASLHSIRAASTAEQSLMPAMSAAANRPGSHTGMQNMRASTSAEVDPTDAPFDLQYDRDDADTVNSADASDRMIYDARRDKNMSAGRSDQQSTIEGPGSGDTYTDLGQGIFDSVLDPAAGIPYSISPPLPGQDEGCCLTEGHLQAILSNASSADKVEQHSPALSHASPCGQLEGQSETGHSYAEKRSHFPAEHSPHTLPGPSNLVALSPYSQHTSEVKELAGTQPRATSFDRSSHAEGLEHLRQDSRVQADVNVNEGSSYSPTKSNKLEPQTAADAPHWHSNALSLEEGSLATECDKSNVSMRNVSRKGNEGTEDNCSDEAKCADYSIGQDGDEHEDACSGEGHNHMDTDRHSISPEEDELSRTVQGDEAIAHRAYRIPHNNDLPGSQENASSQGKGSNDTDADRYNVSGEEGELSRISQGGEASRLRECSNPDNDRYNVSREDAASQGKSSNNMDADGSNVSQEDDEAHQDKGLPSNDMDNDRYIVRKEEDELSMRMRRFLARLPDSSTTVSAGGDSDSVGPGSAFSLQAEHGSEGQSDQENERERQEQAHEEGQATSNGSMDIHFRLETLPVRAGMPEDCYGGSDQEAGREWGNSTAPAAAYTAAAARVRQQTPTGSAKTVQDIGITSQRGDAACTVSAFIAAQRPSTGNEGTEHGMPSALGTSRSVSADDRGSEGSDVAPRPSISSNWGVSAPVSRDGTGAVTADTARPQTATGPEVTAHSKPSVLETPSSFSADDRRYQGAHAASASSISPAYSMLPLDRDGAWPSGNNSLYRQESPVAYKHQPSRLSMTTPRASLPTSLLLLGNVDGEVAHARAVKLAALHESKQRLFGSSDPSVSILGITSAESRHLGATSTLAGPPGSVGRSSTEWHKHSMQSLFGPSVSVQGIESVERHEPAVTESPSDPPSSTGSLSTVWRRDRTVGLHQGIPHVSKNSSETDPPTQLAGAMRSSYKSLIAQEGSMARQFPEQFPGHKSVAGFAERAMPWDRLFGETLPDSVSADAEMQHSQKWLSMHGYSDATVHVTATLPKVTALPSADGSDSKAAAGASPMIGPLQASQMFVDSLPGAIQQSSAPGRLSIAANRKQSPLQSNSGMDASCDLQMHESPAQPVTPTSKPSGMAFEENPIASAASSAQKPVNGRDVALDRTIPSIWDLDV